MESERRRLRRFVPAFAAWSFVVAACAAPAPEATLQVEAPPELIVAQEPQVERFSLPDITTRPLPPEVLAGMLPGDAAVTTRSNEQLVLDAVLDREDQADDVVAHRRGTGVAAEYERTDGSAHVWIDVLEDPAAAHDYLVDLSGDIAKGVDGTHRPGAAVSSVSEFAIDAGEESIGLVGTLADGSVETLVLTRIGRLVVFSSEIRADDTDTRVAVQYLVDDTIERVLESLTGSAVDRSPRLVPSYRFLTTVEVSGADETWRIEADGTLDGADRQCTVARSTPLSADTTEVVVLEGARWISSGESARFSAVGANAEAAASLAWCPMWPLGLNAAVLDGIAPAADPPRHHVNGVDATGYQGTLVDLADATGIDAAAVALESFSFWVADGTDYVVELALIVEGPTDALRPLIGSEFDGLGDVTVSIRHRVFDLGATDPIIAPN
jgi:hypothetical protein